MPYEAITTTGGIIVKEGEKPPLMLRCVSCGAVGNANLCDKCFHLHIEAMDIHTNGLFSALIRLHKQGGIESLIASSESEKNAKVPPEEKTDGQTEA